MLRIGRTAWLRSALVAGLLCGVCGCASSSTNRSAPLPAEKWRPVLPQLMPSDLDVVLRIDWARVRREQLESTVLGLLDAAGLSDKFRSTLEKCLPQAASLLVGARLGDQGFDGDLVAIAAGGGGRPGGPVPCGLHSWSRGDPRGAVEVFEPLAPVTSRGAPALMLRSGDRDVLLATPGQVDAVVRELREGADGNRLAPHDEGIASLDARVHLDVVPLAWRERSPVLAMLADGMLRLQGVLALGAVIKCDLTLTYADSDRARAAGERLREIRTALMASPREVLGEAARNTHATLQREVLRVHLSIPR